MSRIPIPDVNVDLIPDNFFANENLKEVYGLVSSGRAFRNPLETRMTLTESFTKTFTYNQLDRWSGLIDPTPVGFFPTDFVEIKNSIENNYFSAFESFRTHTNLMSGVANTTASDIPNLRTLMSVGSSSVALDRALDRAVGNPCGKLLTAFASLFLGEEPLNEALQYYQSMIGLIENAETTKTEILGKIEELQNGLETLIQNDKDYFDGLVNDLLFAATSQMLPGFFNSQCGNFILEKTIGRTGLISFLKS